jgi:hypothetical protein
VGTAQVRGKLSKFVSVVTNDRATPELRLQCEAEVRSAFTLEPNILNLGSIKRDAAKIAKTMHITRGAGGPIKPRVMTTNNPLVKAELREIEAGATYDLDVVAEPPWPNGTLRASVQIETGVSEVPMETIMVTGLVTPRLRAMPSRFYVRPDDKKELRLTARLAWDEKPGNATAVTVNDPALTAQLEEQGGKQTVVLTGPPGFAVTPGKNIQVNVRTDDPVMPMLQIPVVPQPTPAGAPAAGLVGGPKPPAVPSATAQPTAARASPVQTGTQRPK